MADNIHVLVVDDNQINRQYFLMALNKFGFNVSIAENGCQAIEQSQTTQFDIILMDIRMPDMDGNQTTENIRNINLNKDTPILAISAEINHQSNNGLFNGFILKPVSPNQLLQSIEKYCVFNKTNHKIFDQAKALKYAYDDPQILDKLIGMFLNEIPLQMEFLERSIMNEDYSDSHNIIHKLRGSCQTCGAIALEVSLKSLSNLLNQGKTDINKAFNEVENSVSDYINTIVKL